MKQPIVIVAALAASFSVQAQSLEEGIKMYNYERYESAKKELAPLAAKDPVANYYLGLSELSLGNVDAASGIFSKYADSYAGRAGAARVSFAKGLTAEGNQTAQALANTAKKKEWEQLKYAADALTYSEGGNKQMAVEWYKQVQERKPDMNVLVEMGDAYLELPNGAGNAMTNYEKAAEKDPKNSLAFSRIGKLWYDAKKYDDALKNYEKAKEADPTNPLPYKYLADAYFWVNNLTKSKENLEKYLQYSDKTNEDMLRYASTLYLTKDYQNAINVSNDLMKKGVQKPALYGILAFSYLETKDSVNALNNVRSYFAKQDPKKIGWIDYINYGKIMIANNMADSANVYFDKAIAANPSADKSDVYKEIADLYVARKSTNDYLAASNWYRRIVMEKPAGTLPTPTEYFNWGVYSYYGREYDSAARAYQIMEEKYPTQPSAVYWRGRVAAARDEEAKEGTALPFYEKWLGMEVDGYQPKNSDLMQAYQYITLYYFNKNNKEKTLEYLAKVEAIEANNTFAKQIRDYLSKAGKKG